MRDSMERFITGTSTGLLPSRIDAEDSPSHGIDVRFQRYWGVITADAMSHGTSATVTLSSDNAHAVQPPVPTDVDVVRSLHELTGLSWEQLARLIGVSRRSMHFWAAGGTVSKRHAERLRMCLNMIKGYGRISPDLVRARLFAADPDGVNDFDRFRLGFRGKPINGTIRKAADLLEDPES